MSGVTTASVRHVDLEATAEIAPDDGMDGALAVFWWRGIPLGKRLFTAGELPVPASAVPALAAATSAPALAARGFVDPDELPNFGAAKNALEVSVIVCTRDRPEDLARCLDSLLACDPAPKEIVVVDNAPDRPATRQVVDARAPVRRIAEPRPGLSVARNAGLAAVSSEIVAFTDDDVVVSRGWLAPLGSAFADPAVGAVTGLVLPAELDTVAAAAFELTYGGLAGGLIPVRYDSAFLLPPTTPWSDAAPVWRIGAGANMALRRKAINRVGGFDERLGAGAAGCSEDSEIVYRLLRNGWICSYEPAGVVFHYHRRTISALRSQLRAYMRGHIAALLVQFGHSRAIGNLIRAFVALPIWFAFVLLGTYWRGDRFRRTMLPWEVVGMAEGWVALLRQRRRGTPDTRSAPADPHGRPAAKRSPK